jgi:hypothetical protein
MSHPYRLPVFRVYKDGIDDRSASSFYIFYDPYFYTGLILLQFSTSSASYHQRYPLNPHQTPIQSPSPRTTAEQLNEMAKAVSNAIRNAAKVSQTPRGDRVATIASLVCSQWLNPLVCSYCYYRSQYHYQELLLSKFLQSCALYRSS